MYYYFGIEVNQNEDRFFISQKKYTQNLLEMFKINNCKIVSTPLVHNEKLQKEDRSGEGDASQYRSLIGSLLYLTTTRPNIMYAICLLSRFIQKSNEKHYGIARRILRYLQSTNDYGIH
ncbi:hypothetical protein AAHE18_14G126900 [Arachis hypogaea]